MNKGIVISVVVVIVIIAIGAGLYFGGVFKPKNATVGEIEKVPVPVVTGPPPALTGTAAVELGKFGIDPWTASAKFVAPAAQWIWNSANAASGVPTGASVKFMNQYWNAETAPLNVTLHIMVDDSATVYINGKEVGKLSGGWGTPDYPKLPVTFSSGNNLIEITASNSGGPAGIVAAFVDSKGAVLLRTDQSWVTA